MRRLACLAVLLIASVASAKDALPPKAQLEKQKAALKAKDKAAQDRAAAEIKSGKYRDSDLFKDHPQGEAVTSRAQAFFGRTQRRLLKAVDDAIEFIDAGEPQNARVVLQAWGNNRRQSTERQGLRHVRSAIQRVNDSLPGLARDDQHTPGTPGSAPVPSVWNAPRALSAAEVYSGPWSEKDAQMSMPGPNTVVRLLKVRDLDADGMHMSATGIDPQTGKELKIKLGDGYVMNAAAIMGRLVTAMGYHSPQATYFVPELKVEPQLLIAAHRYKQKIGVRVREDSALTKVGVPPGKHGYTPFGFDSRQIASLELASGEIKQGEEAIELLLRANKSPALLASIKHVTLKNVAVQTEENEGHAVGPWDLDAMPERDMTALRGYSMIASWTDTTDVRLSNNQLVVGKDQGKPKLMYVFSDVGSTLQQSDPRKLSDTVNVNLFAKRIHSDTNRVINRSFDRTTKPDALWGMERIAGLSPAQIEASVAAGVNSYPLMKFLTARLIARRNDMVRKLGLEAKHGILPVPSLARVTGSGPVVLDGPGGGVRFEMPEGGFQVINGQLVQL